jgi:RNA polymerase sigma factor (sigma-70 family)
MATGPNRQVKPSEIDLDQLVVQFRPVVGFKVKKSLGGGNPDWEDVTNEILMQVIEKVRTGEFRGQSSIGTFIYTVTTRRIVDYIRQKTRVLRGAPEGGSLPDPHDQLEHDERAERLAEAIRGLKPKFRDEEARFLSSRRAARRRFAVRLGLQRGGISPSPLKSRLGPCL